MLESSKKYRAHFRSKGEQGKWITEVRKKLSMSEIAALCNCSDRTIRDWQRERFSMDYMCMTKIAKAAKMRLPQVRKVDAFAHTSHAGKKGAAAIIKKYGRMPVDENTRKEKWKEWWDREGKKKHIPVLQPKDIIVPKESEKLAEFVGIMIGDGTVAPYHIAITLHAVDDRAYITYVSRLIHELFDVQPKIYKKSNCAAVDVVVARKKLSLLMFELGLPKGNKIAQDLSVPQWISNNEVYARACVRGLMDTDGSAFTHTYKVKGKTYSYKKLSFTSASPTLRDDVAHILYNNNIRSSCFGTNVRIESRGDVGKYMRIFGSHNPKHLKRYAK